MSEKKFIMKDLKSKALENLKGRWSPMVLATLVYVVVTGILSALNPSIKGIESTGTIAIYLRALLFIALALLVSPVIRMAYFRFSIKFANTTDESKVEEMFKMGKPYKPAYAVYWANFLKIFLWMLPYCAIMVACTVIGIMLSYSETENKSFLIAVIILIVAAVVYMIFLCKKIISYFLSYYIVAEDPSVKAFDAIRKSVELTKGSCGRIFLFGLSFTGWILLGCLTLGIGLLWVIPYMQLSFYHLYKKLSANE